MHKRNVLREMCVGDVWKLVEEKPTIILADEPLVKVLKKIVKRGLRDTVYVVTKSQRLCGTVSMRALLTQLFPLQAVGEDGGAGARFHFGAVTVGEIMNLKPRYVTTATPLSEMARIMMRERVNELAVVDERMRLRGEVNVAELFSGYLRLRDAPPDPPPVEDTGPGPAEATGHTVSD